MVQVPENHPRRSLTGVLRIRHGVSGKEAYGSVPACGYVHVNMAVA
jgi:hypothetical protein